MAVGGVYGRRVLADQGLLLSSVRTGSVVGHVFLLLGLPVGNPAPQVSAFNSVIRETLKRARFCNRPRDARLSDSDKHLQ